MDKNYKKIAISLEEHWIEVIKNGHNPLIVALYFEQFWKQNINFLEILFTPYVLLDNKFAPYWKELTSYKEDIARFNEVGAVKTMYGMALEKYKALKYPYPTIKWKIDKWGYDGKQLHHILRIE